MTFILDCRELQASEEDSVDDVANNGGTSPTCARHRFMDAAKWRSPSHRHWRTIGNVDLK